MKSLRSIVSLLCIMSLVIALLAGCRNNDETKATDTSKDNASEIKADNEVKKEDSESAEMINLRFSWWGGEERHQATLEAIDAYMTKNPNVNIEAEYMGYDGYYKKLLVQFAGGMAPDIFQDVPQWFPEFAAQGDFLADLNDYTEYFDLSTYDQTLLESLSTYEEEVLGVTTGMRATTMIYNQEIFDKYGIAEKQLSWDDLIEVGTKLHQENEDYYLTSGDLDIINMLFLLPYVSQKTGEMWVKDDYSLGVNEADLVDGLQFISDLFVSGTMEPLGESTAFIGKMEQHPKWVNGQLGFVMDYTSGLTKMKAVTDYEINVANTPMHENAIHAANPMMPATMFSISKDSKHPEEAAKFMNFILNEKEGALILKDTRGTPGSESARNALAEAGMLDPLINKAMDLAGKTPSLTWNSKTQNTQIGQINKDVIEKIAFGVITPEEGAKEILEGYENTLKEMQDQ